MPRRVSSTKDLGGLLVGTAVSKKLCASDIYLVTAADARKLASFLFQLMFPGKRLVGGGCRLKPVPPVRWGRLVLNSESQVSSEQTVHSFYSGGGVAGGAVGALWTVHHRRTCPPGFTTADVPINDRNLVISVCKGHGALQKKNYSLISSTETPEAPEGGVVTFPRSKPPKLLCLSFSGRLLLVIPCQLHCNRPYFAIPIVLPAGAGGWAAPFARRPFLTDSGFR